MIDADKCVICDGEIRCLRRALVAPFLARRIWNRSAFCVELVRCGECGFMFYNPRLEAAEEGRLYAGYRSQEYHLMRHDSEPWYTTGMNARLASTDSYERRRQAIRAILDGQIRHRRVRRVLDYGGDRGDLVRGLVDGADAFVYDISGVPAVEGVTATGDPASCKADLIINSNVLEHVGSPRRLLGEISRSSEAGSLILLEVPCESPLAWARIARRVAQIAITSLMRPALARWVVRPASLYMMHEHINFFTAQSLTALMRHCGCAVEAAGVYKVEGPLETGSMAWCLGTNARLTPDAAKVSGGP